jgi:NADPH-dependent ferric siderophore reductase
MIYPVVVKKIADQKYVAYCLITDSIFASAPTMRLVLEEVSGQFASRVHDKEALIDVIVMADSASDRAEASVFDTGKWA